MTADLHGSASLTVTGTADLLDHGRDPGAVDELRITAGLRRGGSVRITAEIARYKGDDADEVSVEFTADLDAATCGRLGRMLLALADEREPAPLVALPGGGEPMSPLGPALENAYATALGHALAGLREALERDDRDERLAAAIAHGDKAREALGSALTQLRDLSTHAQLLLDLATEAVEIDHGTGEIVSTPRGTVERVKAAMAAMVELRKMVW